MTPDEAKVWLEKLVADHLAFNDDVTWQQGAALAVLDLVAAEREACAKIADAYVEKAWAATDIAADIRART